MAIASWLSDTRRIYFDNATSVRDYRVQLRGNRSVLLFGAYLVVLIGVAMTVYSNVASDQTVNVVDAQWRLQAFYGTVVGLLAGIVSLVAPALTATSVVMERQRRSLDLVFSAPVSPKYYLVGKILSSFRYTWMLLVLALPITAACVVMGGASWSDVLCTYVALSAHGLVFTALALFMSTLAPKPVSAVVWSYAAASAYLILTLSLTGSAFIGRSIATQEAPFYAGLNPFLLSVTINSYSTVWGVQVPIWAFSVVLSLLAVKLMLLAAGTLLSASPAKEIASLRVHLLAYFSAIAFYVGMYNATDAQKIVFAMTLPLAIVMPFLSTFGVDGERRYRPNGLMNWRLTFAGTPAGSLSYLMLFLVAGWGASLAGHSAGGHAPTMPFNLAMLVYFLGFWIFFWSIGRYASSLFLGLRSARLIQFAIFTLLVIIPVPFLSGLSSYRYQDDGLWWCYILRPLWWGSDLASLTAAINWGFGLLVSGTGLTFLAERNVRRILTSERLANERLLAET